MSYLKKILKLYINTSLHVALSVYALTRITEWYLGLSYNEPLDYFIFYGTITGYNFVKYAGLAKLHHRSLTHNLRFIQAFSFICFLLMCYYGTQISIKTWFVILPMALLTFLYAVPLLGGFQKNLRSISYLKILIVGIIWAGTTVLLPIYDAGMVLDMKGWGMFIQRLLFVMILILPFDIRDVKFDAISLQTIPKKIGILNTKKLGVVMLLICLGLEFSIGGLPVFQMAYVSISILLLWVLLKSSVKQPEYFSSFWVESIPIVWLIFLMIFGYIL